MTDTERVLYPKRIESRTAAALGPIVEAIQNKGEIAEQEAEMREALWKKAEPMLVGTPWKSASNAGGGGAHNSPFKSLPISYGSAIDVNIRGFMGQQVIEPGKAVPILLKFLIVGKIPTKDGTGSIPRVLFDLHRVDPNETSRIVAINHKNNIASLSELHSASAILDGLALANQIPTPPQPIPQA